MKKLKEKFLKIPWKKFLKKYLETNENENTNITKSVG